MVELIDLWDIDVIPVLLGLKELWERSYIDKYQAFSFFFFFFLFCDGLSFVYQFWR